MTEKILKTRLVNKHDIQSNWEKSTNFIPMQGEIICFDIDENYSYERIKIGNGIDNVNNLPFLDNSLELITVADIDTICSSSMYIVDPNVETF